TVVASGSRMRLDDVQAEADYQAVADVSDGELEFTLR
ncbi:MAG: peptidase, partial [Stenotrophomonas maltophilia]|nr:peptidase [Stenotrophomonas maltophilia]